MGSYTRDPVLQLPATALPGGTCRALSIPYLAETQVQALNTPFTCLLHVFLHVFWFCLGFGFFFLAHLTSHLPLQPEGWDQVGKGWRERTWQTGLPSLTKQTKLKAIPTSQASHPKDNTNRNSLASNSKHPRLKGGVTWLSSVEVLTSPEVRSHMNMGLLSRNWKRHWRGTNTWQKGLIAQTTLTLGSMYPLVPSSLLSPNIPICLKAPPASCQAATPSTLQVLFVSGNK